MVSFAIVDVVDVEIPRLLVGVPEVPVGTVGVDLERLPDVENLADVRFLIAVEVLDAGPIILNGPNSLSVTRTTLINAC